jgi:malate dehydrogenase (oxaloacetate-decarboxylating)(NADP+)
VGLGVIVSEANQVIDEMFSAAARALADQVSNADLEQGLIYPPLAKIREVSAVIASAVAEVAYTHGLARKPRPDDLLEAVRSKMYTPEYESYV